MLLKPSTVRTLGRKPFCQTRIGITILVLWTILTVCLVAFTAVTLSYSSWLENTKSEESLGLFDKCTRYQECLPKILKFSRVYSSWWKAVAVFVSFATALFAISPFVVVLRMVCFPVDTCRGFFIAAVLEGIGAFNLLLSCFLFPLGWKSGAVSQVCGLNANYYSLGNCQMGWTYVLLMLATSDAIILTGVVVGLMERRRIVKQKSSLIMDDYWISNTATPDENNDIEALMTT